MAASLHIPQVCVPSGPRIASKSFEDSLFPLDWHCQQQVMPATSTAKLEMPIFIYTQTKCPCSKAASSVWVLQVPVRRDWDPDSTQLIPQVWDGLLLFWQLAVSPPSPGKNVLHCPCTFTPPPAQLSVGFPLPVLFSITLYQLHFLYIDFYVWGEQPPYLFLCFNQFLLFPNFNFSQAAAGLSWCAFTNWCSPLPLQPEPVPCQLPTFNLGGDILYSFSPWPPWPYLCYCRKKDDCLASMNHLSLIFSDCLKPQPSLLTTCFLHLSPAMEKTLFHYIATFHLFAYIMQHTPLQCYEFLSKLLFFILNSRTPQTAFKINLGRNIVPSASDTTIITNLKGNDESQGI